MLTLLAACSTDGREARDSSSTAATATTATAVTAATRTTTPATTATTTGAPIVPLLTGFGLSPRTYEGSGLPDYLALVSGNADLLLHAGAWSELAQPGSAFHVLSALAGQQAAQTVIVLSPSSAGSLLQPLDEATRVGFLGSLRAFLAEYQPAYLGLANEVNLLAAADPGAFEQVVALWNDALPIVRELSPTTKVFVTFQYESLLGHRDGWFGEAVTAPDWAPVQRFAGADMVGLTTYPSLVFDEPSALPADYYAQIAQHTDLPVILTEVGWTADETLPLLPGSEAEQVAFIDVLAAQAVAAGVEAMVGTLVCGDQVQQPAFTQMDLRRDDGSPRPAWDRWLALRA